MSGGNLNYAYHKVEQVAEDVRFRATCSLHRAFAVHLSLVAKALHDLEWVLSGDCSPGDEEEAIRKVVTRNEEVLCIKQSTEELIEELQKLIKEP